MYSNPLHTDAEQLMLWSEGAGRNYVTAQTGLRLVKQWRTSMHGRCQRLLMRFGPDRAPDDVGTNVLRIARGERRLE